MKVLSLFDGMSCGRIALDRAEIQVEKYYASEVDKYAQIVSHKNYPDIIRLGDVNTWMAWGDLEIDLLIGGSPCQGFSFAGKQLNFDDPRSALFFQFVNCLHHFKPKYFLLENVVMKKEYQKIISDLLGVEPIMINSALVSAQNRKRLYWTNIPGVTQPEDKGIVLKDIIESNVDETYNLSKKLITGLINGSPAFQGRFNPHTEDTEKSYCLTARYAKMGRTDPYILCKQIVEGEGGQGAKTGLYLIVPEATKQGYAIIGEGEGVDLTFPTSKTRRGRRMEDKCNALTAANYDYNFFENMTVRKLTPIECERLQTVPDNYTEGVSNSQRYKMLGNGWTVDVIAHILKGIK